MIRFLKILLVLLMLPPLLWLSIIVLNVHLPLSILNTPLSAAASYALGRNVSFGGVITVAPTLVPTLEITEVTIGNPEGWEGRLLHLGRVYLEIDLVSLLRRKIVVEEFLAQQVALALEVVEDDVGNWLLTPPAELAADEEGDGGVDMGADNEWRLTADVRHVSFEQISVSYLNEARNLDLLFELDRLEGRMRWAKDILLESSGTYQHQPWRLAIKGGSIRDLLQRKPGWGVAVDTELSGLEFRWQMDFLADGSENRVRLKGPSLATLSPVANVTLPDWGPYELSGTVTTALDAHDLKDFKLRFGESQMSGSLNLRMKDDIPHLKIDLNSKHLQMNDFRLAGDSETVTVELETTGENLPETAASSSQPVDIEALLSPEVLEHFRVELSLAFDEIMSGKDRLGSGNLRAKAGGDRVTVEELHVNLPAGDIDLAGEARSAESGYQLTLSLDIENFDYGVVARREDPESDLKGQFFLKVDLQSTTRHLDEAMATGNGSLAFAVWPEEFKSGVIDLWAVGLLSAALTQFESQSVVNCVVARFDLDDGIMHERALMIDTSEIRVLGDAVIDFPSEKVDVFMVPRSKKPQFISAATPVQLKGSFDDFEPKIKRSDIAFSVVRSGFNIALLGIPLLFHKTLEADGSADCRRAMTEDFRLERRKS